MLSGNDVQKQLVAEWCKQPVQETDEERIENFMKHTVLLDQLSHGKIASVIFSYKNLHLYHVSPGAATFFCSTAAEIMKKGNSWIFERFEEYQKKFILKANKILAEKMLNAPPDELLKASTSYVNWKINCTNGTVRRCMLHFFPVLISSGGQPILGIYLVHDMEPYMKEDHWWYRFKVGNCITSYYNNGGKFKNTDILSSRELEILQLMAKNFSSKEISERLFLSPHTVDNHRRRMFQRTGAQDTSSLIHICKMCGVL